MAGIAKDWIRNALIATAATGRLLAASPAWAQETTPVTAPEVHQKAETALNALAGNRPVGLLPTEDMRAAAQKVRQQIPPYNARQDYNGLKKMAAETFANALVPLGPHSHRADLGQTLLNDQTTLSEALQKGAEPHNYYIPDGKTSFIVVPGSGRDIFKPTAADRTFFERETGIKDLDLALGPDTAAKTRLFCLLHETRHAGDLTLLNETMAERRKGLGTSLSTPQERGGEVRADLMTAQLYYGMTRDLDYVIHWSQGRMLEMMLDDKARHVTPYALNDWIKTVAPQANLPPSLADSQIDQAYMELRKTLWREGPALLKERGIERPKGNMGQREEGLYLMKAIKPCLDRGLIKDKGAQTLAKGVQKALDHFESVKSKADPALDKKASAQTNRAKTQIRPKAPTPFS